MSAVSTGKCASTPLSIAVLVSGQGRGSNLGALLDACACGEIRGRISIVIGTRSDAPALTRARDYGVNVAVVSPRKYEDNEASYSDALLRILRKNEAGLICLAGYMRKLPEPVLAEYSCRIMNIHPALLPFFGGKGMYGLHVHEAVLESGMKLSGCTVHFVDADYDTGPIILQHAVPVLDSDTPESLAQRVLEEEHRCYVQAVKLFAAGCLITNGNKVLRLSETVDFVYQPVNSEE